MHYRDTRIPSQVVQHTHVGIGVIEVVRIGWVIFFGPVGWQRTVKIENVVLRFGLIIHAVKAHHLLIQESRQQINRLVSLNMHHRTTMNSL